MDQSDAYRIHVCESCGLIAVANLQKQEFECRSCRKGPQTRIVQARACSLSFLTGSPPLPAAPVARGLFSLPRCSLFHAAADAPGTWRFLLRHRR